MTIKRTSVMHTFVKSFAFGLGEVFACGRRMYRFDIRRSHPTHQCPACTRRLAAVGGVR